jgi:hypothetical protein
MKRLPKDALLEEVYQVLRSNNSIWMSIDDSLSVTDAEQIVELTYSRLSDGRVGKRRWTRLKKLFVITSIVLSIGGSGSFAVARLITTEKPRIVLAGVVCRETATQPSNGVVLGINGDPIGACRKNWETGTLAMARKGGPIPHLAACISKQNVVEVFPAFEEICAQMGLRIADLQLDKDQEKVVAMQKRVMEVVNNACVSLDAAQRVVKEILQDLKLLDWKLKIGVNAASEPCSIVAFLEDQKTLEISSRGEWRNHEKIISR